VWGDDGTNPTSQVGTDSGTISLDSTGVKTLTFGTPVPVNKGTTYWFVLVDSSGGSGSSIIHQITAHSGGIRSGGHDTITSIARGSNDQTRDLKFEVVVETTEEPTPDHDTVFYLTSNTTDGSTTFDDASARDHSITRSGDTHHDSGEQKFGTTAMYFDGTGDHLVMPDHNDFKFDGDYTVDLWFYTSSTSGGCFFSKHNSAVANIGLFINRTTAGKIRWQDDQNSIYAEVGSSLNNGAWHHLALVRCGSGSNNLKLYIDGTLASTQSGTTAQTQSSDFAVGYYINDNSHYLNGYIDEFRVSQCARWDADFDVPTAAYS